MSKSGAYLDVRHSCAIGREPELSFKAYNSRIIKGRSPKYGEKETVNMQSVGIRALRKGLFSFVNSPLYAGVFPIFTFLHFPPFSHYSADPFCYLPCI